MCAMKKIFIMLLIGIIICLSIYSVSLAIEEYSVDLHIDCLENLVFSKYDVDVYFEDQLLVELLHGAEYSGSVVSEAGTKHLYFYCHDNHDVNGVLEFNVLDNSKVDCIIGCHNDRISVNKVIVDTEKVILNIEEVLPFVPEDFFPGKQNSLANYEKVLSEGVSNGIITYRQANTLLNYAQNQQKWAADDSISFVKAYHGKTTTNRRYHLIVSFSANCAVLDTQSGGSKWSKYGKVSGNATNGFIIYWEDGTLDDYIIGTNNKGSKILLTPEGDETGFTKCSDYPVYFHFFDDWSYSSGFDLTSESMVTPEPHDEVISNTSEEQLTGNDELVAEDKSDGSFEENAKQEETLPAEQIARIVLDKKEVTIITGKTESIKAEVVGLPEGEPMPKFEWSTSDKAIATCVNGRIKAIKAGNALITCSCSLSDGTIITEECAALVIVPVSSIAVNPKAINLSCGERFTISYMIKPENASIKDLEFVSSMPEIATVDKNGVVEGVSAGNTVILAKTLDGSEKKATISVKVVDNRISLETAKRVALVGIGNDQALDIFTSDGNHYDKRKFHDYQYAVHALTIVDEGEWTTSDGGNSWHVENYLIQNKEYKTFFLYRFDVKCDGRNYTLENVYVVSAKKWEYFRSNDPSKLGASDKSNLESNPYLIITPKQIK